MDPTNLQAIDVSGVHLSLVERQSELPSTAKTSIPCILPDRDYIHAT